MMMISPHEQHLIAAIDQQMQLLQQKQATPQTVVNTLIDWVPETRCLIDSADDKALDLYLRGYPHFAKFARLVSGHLIGR